MFENQAPACSKASYSTCLKWAFFSHFAWKQRTAGPWFSWFIVTSRFISVGRWSDRLYSRFRKKSRSQISGSMNHFKGLDQDTPGSFPCATWTFHQHNQIQISYSHPSLTMAYQRYHVSPINTTKSDACPVTWVLHTYQWAAIHCQALVQHIHQ